ncbi:MAG: hypothetical protein AB1831_15040 [Pseudomonadota bacterium]
MSLLAGLRKRLAAPRIDADLAEAIARVVDQLEPRLRQIGGYPRRYAAAVGHAVAYCRALAGQVPGPVTVSRHAFTQDPLVHALFGSAESIVEVLAQNKAVREWQEAHASEPDVYALMVMRLQERHTLGVDEGAGGIRRDVPQTVVYFSEHTLTNLATTPEAARELLARQFLAALLARVKDRIDEIRQRKQHLETERDELQAKLRAHGDDAGLREALAGVLHELSEVVTALDLRHYAEHIETVFMQPQLHLHGDPISLSLDAMGIRQIEGVDGRACTLHLSEMVCKDRRRWAVLLVRVGLADLPPYRERLASAERWLGAE